MSTTWREVLGAPRQLCYHLPMTIRTLATLTCVIRHALFPGHKTSGSLAQTAAQGASPAGATVLHDDALGLWLSRPESALDGSGRFVVFIPACPSLAAPFILFRLKRRGFSACVAEGVDRGVLVRGRR